MEVEFYELYLITGILLIIIAVVGSLGNFLTVIALGTSRNRSSSTTVLMINLAVSILPLCLVTLPFRASRFIAALTSGPVPANRTLTVFDVTEEIVTGICGQIEIITVAALAINRACAVATPLFYRSYMEKPIVIWGSIIFIWVCSLLIWTPLAVLGKLKTDKDPYFVVPDDGNELEVALHSFFGYALPPIVAIVCHVVMLYKFCYSQVLKTAGAKSTPRENQVTLTVTTIFVLLLLVSIPHFVVHFLARTDEYPKSWIWTHTIYFARMGINPFVYVYTNARYREECFRVIGYIFPCWKRSSNNDLEKYSGKHETDTTGEGMKSSVMESS